MNTTSTQMSALDIITETLQHYHDTKAFGFDHDLGVCLYRTEQGNRCALGRCLLDDSPPILHPMRFECYDAAQLDRHLHAGPGGLDEMLKPEYRGHPLGFWRLLQRLHDNWAQGFVGVRATLEALLRDYASDAAPDTISHLHSLLP